MTWINQNREPGDEYDWNDVIVITIVIEHVLITLKFGLQVLIPDVP